ncbi:MAG TPA: hypothetical protein VKZ60_00590 [Chloroflexota bacterium]|jgi:hypothetical protein|nr:hypothetical protein [Chloroflexota bacterium]
MRQFVRVLVVAGLTVLLLTSLSASVAAASSGPADPAVSALLPVQSDLAHPLAWWWWWVSWWWPWPFVSFTWPWVGWWWPWPFVSLVIW